MIDFSDREREITDLEITFLVGIKGETCLMVSGDESVELPVFLCGDKKKTVVPKLKNGAIIFAKKE